MKLTFQQRSIASFLVAFALFAGSIVLFEQARARHYKTEALEERLDAYAEEMLRHLSRRLPPDSLTRLMPAELRLTIVGRDGRVIHDNATDPTAMGNHASRPEIATAMSMGRGSDIRTSVSNNKPYLYYAKYDGGGFIVRAALPYDIKVRSFLKPDNAFLYFVIALFVVGMGAVWYVTEIFGRAEQRMRRLELREKSRVLKRELTGNIAHELRTPLTSIRGFLEILLDKDLTQPRAHEYLSRAYNQTLAMSGLISDMSLLTRLVEKRETFRFSEVDIEKLLERVRTDTAARLSEKNISLTVEIPKGLTVTGNEGLLYSVFRNLVDNVALHAGENVRIDVRAAHKSDGATEFTFSDNGPGIPEERHFERLFERFYRVDEGRTRDSGGSGLGLSIVKNTVELHGGEISVRNIRPHGLEFTFTIMRAVAS